MLAFVLSIIATAVVGGCIVWLAVRAYQEYKAKEPAAATSSRQYGVAALAMIPLAILAALGIKWAYARRQALEE